MRIGCDLVHVPRIAASLAKPAFLTKVYHPHEVAYCQARSSTQASLAARFAAKEAFVKALGTGLYVEGITPTDVWVENDERGKPLLRFSESVKSVIAREGFTGCDVSLSHHGDYALATVILF